MRVENTVGLAYHPLQLEQGSCDCYKDPDEHDRMHGWRTCSGAGVDERHRTANRLVQARQQGHVRAARERHGGTARVGILCAVQRGRVVVPV